MTAKLRGTGRPSGRLFCCRKNLRSITWLGIAWLALAWIPIPGYGQEPTKTLISDVIYRADGTPAGGNVLITWPTFTTGDGKAVAAGSKSVVIGAGGVVNIELAPNQGAAPEGTYYRVVLSLNDGSTSTEYWNVPATSPTTIAAIRTSVAPSSVATQFASRSYVDQALAAAVLKTGDQAVAGIKTFSSSPLVPEPQVGAAVANKEYVDLAVASGGPANSTFPLSKGGTGQDTWIASRCVRVANDGTKLESAAADCGGSDFNALQNKPTTLAGYGINDAQLLDANLTTLAIPGANGSAPVSNGTDYIQTDVATQAELDAGLATKGNVSNSGTPADTQVGIWDGATNIKGSQNFTIDTSTAPGKAFFGTRDSSFHTDIRPSVYFGALPTFGAAISGSSVLASSYLVGNAGIIQDAGDGYAIGVYGVAGNTSSSQGNIAGQFDAYALGSGTTSRVLGVGSSVGNGGSGTVSVMANFSTEGLSNYGGGSVGEAYGLYVWQNYGGKGSTRNAGVFIGNQGSGANDYAFYSAGGKSYHAGAFQIGGDLTTNITGSAQCLQVNSSGVVSGTGSDCGAGGSGGISNSAGNNVVMKSDGTNAVASTMSDDGSSVTSTATNGYKAPAFVSSTANPATTGVVRAASNECAVSIRNAANNANVCALKLNAFDELEIGGPGGATSRVAVTQGTTSLGTTAISSGTCRAVTVSFTGILSTDVLTANPASDPTAVTGYGPSASGSLYIWSWLTTDTVNFKVCNNTGASITPGDLSMYYAVSR